jgi:hypothetical protein
VANQGSNSLTVLFGKNDGIFPSQKNIHIDGSPSFVIAGDFNNDTILDLIVTNYVDDTGMFLLRNGDGTFKLTENTAVGGDPISVVSGSFDNDTRLDVGVINTLSGDMSVALNQCGNND